MVESHLCKLCVILRSRLLYTRYSFFMASCRAYAQSVCDEDNLNMHPASFFFLFFFLSLLAEGFEGDAGVSGGQGERSGGEIASEVRACVRARNGRFYVCCREVYVINRRFDCHFFVHRFVWAEYPPSPPPPPSPSPGGTCGSLADLYVFC